MVKIGKLAHDIALENARCLRKSCFIPSHAPRAGRVIDDALAIVHYIEFYGFVLRPRDTHRVGIRLNVLPKAAISAYSIAVKPKRSLMRFCK